MTDDRPLEEAGRDPILKAFGVFSEFTRSAEDLVHLTHEGYGYMTSLPEVFRVLGEPQELSEHREWKAQRARLEIEAGFPNLHAHSLLGLCGALECLVDDVVIGALKKDHSMLQSPGFDKLKLPVSTLFSDDDDRYRAILAEAARVTSANLSSGVTRYENLLKLVRLDGAVPERVRTAIYAGQQIRNIWAHRGGRADRRFVEAVPMLGYAVGQRVEMSAETFLPLMHAFHMYGIVLLNRYLKSIGRDYLIAECEGYKNCLLEIDIVKSET